MVSPYALVVLPPRGRRGTDAECNDAGMVHEVAAAGFSDPGDYEAARPSYPPEAVAWFVEHLADRAGPHAWSTSRPEPASSLACSYPPAPI